MAIVPRVLHEHINTAFPDNVCLVGSIQADGYPQISPRGSVVVLDDETMGFWLRGGGTTAEGVTEGTKLAVYYRNRAFGARGGNGMLPAGGIARFYGTATVHKDGDVYEAVWNKMVQPERDNDPEKKGFAVSINIERAEFLTGKPLPEDLAMPA